MIPKIIHYCWFGKKPKPKLVEKCISSWNKYCPDYKIIEWNETNFDLKYNPYIEYCYYHKRWAYLSDLVRLIVVYQYGGVYLDTDVEVISSIDSLLENDAFYSFENDSIVATGLGFGAIKGHETLKAMIEEYSSFCPNIDDDFHFINCPKLNTRALINMGLIQNGEKQYINGALILPKEYMNPFDDSTGRLTKTANTISIHWYSKSAMSKTKVIRNKITRPIHRVFGVNIFRNTNK